MSRSVAGRSFATLLLTVCAAIAVALALSGIYAIVAQAAAERRTEVGIRMALGGSASAVVRWMLRRTMKPIAIGSVLGVLVASAAARVFATLLFDVGPLDPPTYAIAVGLFVLLAAAAAFVPARSAARTDPSAVLRGE